MPRGATKPDNSADGEPALTDRQRRFVAAFLGEARFNATEAARLAGYKDSSRASLATTGWENLRKPEIKAAIDARRGAIDRQGIAVQQVRVDNLVRRAWLLDEVVAHRAERYRAKLGDDPEVVAARAARAVFAGRDDVPAEATTGLLVEKETVNNAGHRTVEWSVDVGLLREMREHEKQVAQELGDWVERTEGELTTNVVQIVGVDAEKL
ncbi:MAG: terminase small subunit [Chloroflexota bacterium]|nr:terminase small subunit [Chloroflexota bacterium]